MNIYSATELLEIIQPLMPDGGDELDIINSILQKVDPDTASKALCVILGKEPEELPQVSTEDFIAEFVKGIRESKIIELKEFLQEVGYGVR